MRISSLGLLLFAAACASSSAGTTEPAADAAATADAAADTPAPPPPLLTFDVDGSAVIVHLPSEATSLVLTQGTATATFAVAGKDAKIANDVDWSSLLPFTTGTAHWKAGDAEGDVVLGEHFTRAFEVSGAPFPHDGFAGRAQVGETATFAGTAADGGMKSHAIVAHPDYTFDDLALGADKTLTAGTPYTFDVTFKAAGITVVELNATNGIPLISWPVYVGDALPLVVDLIDRPPEAYYGEPLPMKDLRGAMLGLVSELRQSAGLGALVAHDKLDLSAQAMADTIAQEQYFSHTSKSGKKAKDWIAAQGLSGLISDELAVEFSPERAFRYLFWSPAHRLGMLNPKWQSLGTGAAVFSAATHQLVFVLHLLDAAP